MGVRTLAGRIRAELHHTGRVHGNHDRILELQDRFDDREAVPEERARIASEIADINREQTEHLEASRLARATTFLYGGTEAAACWWDDIAAHVATDDDAAEA